LIALRNAGHAHWHEVLAGREYVPNKSATIVSNRASLGLEPGAAFVLQTGPVFVRGRGVTIGKITGEVFEFDSLSREGLVQLENRSSKAMRVRTSWRSERRLLRQTRMLEPGDALVLGGS
jgi:hypothetical protein